jgi:hypothetical protein
MFYKSKTLSCDGRVQRLPRDPLPFRLLVGESDWGVGEGGGAMTEKEVTVEPRPMQGGDGGAAASSGGGLIGVVPGGELGLGAATTRSFGCRRFQEATVDRRWDGDTVGILSQLRVTRGWWVRLEGAKSEGSTGGRVAW